MPTTPQMVVMVPPPPPMRSELGGGFIEFLFGEHGPQPRVSSPPPNLYPAPQPTYISAPAQVVPMLEPPSAAGLPDGPALPAPGGPLRWQGSAGHRDHRYAQPLPLSGRKQRQGDALRHRRRPPRLHLGRHARGLRQKGMAGLGAAQGNAGAPARPAALHGRRAEQSARRARNVSRLDASTASTARTNPGPSVTTSRPAASVCATWMSSTSTSASRSAPRWSCSRVRPAPSRARRARAEIHPN